MNSSHHVKSLCCFVVAFLLVLVLQTCIEASDLGLSQMVLIKGQSRVVPVDKVARVAVGDESIVDVLVLSANQVLLNAKQQGITTLHIWEEHRQHIVQLRVHRDDGTLTRELLSLMDLPGVSAHFVEDTLILDGSVESASQKYRAGLVAGVYSDRVVNLLRYDETYRDDELAEAIALTIGDHTEIAVIRGSVIVEGVYADSHAQTRAVAIAGAFGKPVVDLTMLDQPDCSDPVVPEPEEATETETEEDLVRKVQEAIGRRVSVSRWGETLFLEGTIDSGFEHQRAVAIAEAFGYPVVDLLRVERTPHQDPPLSDGEGTPEEVAAPDYQAYAEEMAAVIGESDVTVRILYDQAILEGEVDTSWQKERAVTLAEVFPMAVIDLIQVRDQPVERIALPSEQEIAVAIDDSQIGITWVNETLFLEGVVEEEFQRERALQIATAFTTSVVDLVRVRQTPATEPIFTLERVPLRLPDTPHISVEMPKGAEEAVECPEESEATQEDSPIEPAWTEDDRQRFQNDLIADLMGVLAEPQVKAVFYQDTLALEGVVSTDAAKRRVEQIASLYHQPLLNLVEVVPPKPKDIAAEVSKLLADDQVNVTVVDDNIVLQGTVLDQAAHSRTLEMAALYGKVVDLLHVARPAQVLLQVHVVELNRTAAQELGFSWGSLECDGFRPNVIRFQEVGRIGGLEMRRSFPLAAQLEALEETGDAKLLAAPSLLTLSGEPASFLVGGEIPLVVMGPNGPQIDWRDYGVQLRMQPMVYQDQVRVDIEPEVSTLDWNNATRVGDILMPALRTRRASTSLRVEEGATLVLGGLIERVERETIRKVPILGDIPVLGLLFQSRSFQEHQTELVIMVTPWIVYQEGVQLYGDQ